MWWTGCWWWRSASIPMSPSDTRQTGKRWSVISGPWSPLSGIKIGCCWNSWPAGRWMKSLKQRNFSPSSPPVSCGTEWPRGDPHGDFFPLTRSLETVSQMRIAAHAVRVWFLYPKQADMSTRPETGRRGTGLPVPLHEGAVYAFSKTSFTSLSRRKRPKTADAAGVIPHAKKAKKKGGFPRPKVNFHHL